ncbi:IS701 family transposase [Streptomyces sp. HC307]|uniref:IS701 family transposase n=1 Tax=Streptomyces flavusporus TaxID=3385496 RepID=UPI0039174830
MTTNQDAVAVEVTVAQAVWRDGFGAAMGLVADCFPRRETRRTLRETVEAVLMGLERINCWTLAEALGHCGPHRLQHFLSRAVWDDEAVRARLAAFTVGHLADDQAMLVVDETGDAKSSTDAVGAAHQYSGALGGVGLCQVAVHLTYVGPAGHALIDRALYLTRDWAADEERRLLTGVPDELVFATKPQLAAAMLAQARAQGFPARWVAADEVYGGVDLRRRIRELGFDYAVAVPASHRVTTPAGRFDTAGVLAKLPRRAWQRIRTGHGTKGDRHYDWVMIEVTADDIPQGHETGHSFLLVRRHRYTRELSFYRCHSTTPVTLSDLVEVICCRWRVEEDFQAAKSLAGLDQGQATCWNSWMRWSLISLIAASLLAVAAARHPGDTESGEPDTEHEPMIALTRPELLRLLRAFVLPQPVTDAQHVLHWSHWRRRHQHRAATCHRYWNEVTAAA